MAETAIIDMGEVRERQAAARQYVARIEEAIERAGYDRRMLVELPPEYIFAALALGVK